jgi:hypothetical protein
MAEGWSRNDTNARASNQLAAGPLLIHLIDLRGARRRRSELPRTRRSHGHHSRFGRAEIRRGFCRSDISVSAPFVWWCLSGSIMAFHIPLIEPDRWLSRFGGSETPSPTADRARSTVRPRSGRKMREWISPALAYRLTLCLTQATGVTAMELAIAIRVGDDLEVFRPSAQRAIQLGHQLCGLLPCSGSSCQRMDGFHQAPDALLRWPAAELGFFRFSLNTSARTHSPESWARSPPPCTPAAGRFLSSFP